MLLFLNMEIRIFLTFETEIYYSVVIGSKGVKIIDMTPRCEHFNDDDTYYQQLIEQEKNVKFWS